MTEQDVERLCLRQQEPCFVVAFAPAELGKLQTAASGLEIGLELSRCVGPSPCQKGAELPATKHAAADCLDHPGIPLGTESKENSASIHDVGEILEEGCRCLHAQSCQNDLCIVARHNPAEAAHSKSLAAHFGHFPQGVSLQEGADVPLDLDGCETPAPGATPAED